MLGLIVKVSTFDDIVFKKGLHIFRFKYSADTIRYDTIEEINVDSKAEYTA